MKETAPNVGLGLAVNEKVTLAQGKWHFVEHVLYF